MDLYHKILAGGIVAAIGATFVVASQWLSAHDAALRAEAQVAADQSTLKKLGDQQLQLADALKAIQADNARQVADLRQTFATATSPAQIAALLSKTLGQPVVIHDTAPTAGNPNPA